MTVLVNIKAVRGLADHEQYGSAKVLVKTIPLSLCGRVQKLFLALRLKLKSLYIQT